jgi:thioredoxin-like negative regulator of GroEL
MTAGWHPGSPPVTGTEWGDLLAAHPVVVVHFWAVWNGVDRLFDQQLRPVREELAGLIEFRSADVDDPSLNEVCRECEVVNVPVLACFVRGRRVATIVGARPAEELRAWFHWLVQQAAGGLTGGCP